MLATVALWRKCVETPPVTVALSGAIDMGGHCRPLQCRQGIVSSRGDGPCGTGGVESRARLACSSRCTRVDGQQGYRSISRLGRRISETLRIAKLVADCPPERIHCSESVIE